MPALVLLWAVLSTKSISVLLQSPLPALSNQKPYVADDAEFPLHVAYLSVVYSLIVTTILGINELQSFISTLQMDL